MIVNKYKIRKPHIVGSTGMTFNVPINQTPWLVGQSDIVDTKFVDVEVENSINEVLDYESVRFVPIIDNEPCDFIIYKLNKLTSGSYNTNTSWGDVGFSETDIKFSKYAYTKTFLNLDFYDSDLGTKQRLLFSKTIFPQPSLIINPNNIPLAFKVGNTLINRDRNGEGFFLYYYKEDVIPTIPKELYMRASLLNAKDGSTTRYMASSNPTNSIDELVKTDSGLLYTKYLLKREEEGYYYEIDDTYSSNITKVPGIALIESRYTVDLFEISVL